MAMKNSQALRENRTRQHRGGDTATGSHRKVCQRARAGRNKEISTGESEQLQPEIRVDGKYIRAVLIDPRNSRVVKVTARRKLITGREREVLGLEPGNSNWSVYVRAVRVPVELHGKLVAGMKKNLRRKGRDDKVYDPRPVRAVR
jgi:hypothetical protein